MAAGLPVVATDIAGIPEQVVDGENEFLVTAGDPEALAERITTLLEDADRRDRFRPASLERAKSFSVDRMPADLDAVYGEVLG